MTWSKLKRPRWLATLAALLLLGGPPPVAAEPSVRLEAEGWTIRSQDRAIIINPTNLALTFRRGEVVWRTLPSQPGEVTLEAGGRRVTHALREASRVEFKPFVTGYSDGVRLQLSGFKHNGREVDALLRLSVSLERDTGEALFEAWAAEGEARVKELVWPRGFEPESVETTIVPFMQGMLLPKGWPRQVHLYDSLA
ncbi:MAG TPA: hypothetical protein P5233_15265, partial [Candidatus Paceibacterota bacterium]|nr:hypothetical protein [Candidatus Paceibacterota bacterium]